MISHLKFSEGECDLDSSLMAEEISRVLGLVPTVFEFYYWDLQKNYGGVSANVATLEAFLFDDEMLLCKRPSFGKVYHEVQSQTQDILEEGDFESLHELTLAKMNENLQILHTDLPYNQARNCLEQLFSENRADKRRHIVDSYDEAYGGKKFSLDQWSPPVKELFSYEIRDSQVRDMQVTEYGQHAQENAGSKKELYKCFAIANRCEGRILHDLGVDYFIGIIRPFWASAGQKFFSYIEEKSVLHSVSTGFTDVLGRVFEICEDGEPFSEIIKNYPGVRVVR